MPTTDPVQPELGVYNETVRCQITLTLDPCHITNLVGVYKVLLCLFAQALRRIDLILREAGKNGVRILLNLSNFEPFLGGWQWWVNQVSFTVQKLDLPALPWMLRSCKSVGVGPLGHALCLESMS